MAAPLPNRRNLNFEIELEKVNEIKEQIRRCANIPGGCQELHFNTLSNISSLRRGEKIQMSLQVKPYPILTFRIIKFIIYNSSNPNMAKNVPAMVLMESNTQKPVHERFFCMIGISNIDSLFQLNQAFLLSINNKFRGYIGNLLQNILVATIRKAPLGGKRTKKRKYYKKKHSKSYKKKVL